MKIKTIIKSAAFIGGGLGLTALINNKINLDATSENLLSYFAEDFFEWKGCRIYFKKYGTSGTPILLLHDIHAAGSAEEWFKIIPELSKNHRVFVLDLLGCGRSDKPSITYTNFIFVEIILEFIKSYICEKTFVVASANTSQIALMASAYDSSKFSGFILINPPSIESTSRTPDLKSRIKMKSLELPILGSALYNMIYSKNEIKKTLIEDSFYNETKVSHKIMQTYYESSHLQDGKGRFLEASYTGKFLNMDISHALKNLSLPFSIYYSVSYKNNELIARSWKKHNSSIILTKLTRTGLYPHLEKPDRISTLIESTIFRANLIRNTH